MLKVGPRKKEQKWIHFIINFNTYAIIFLTRESLLKKNKNAQRFFSKSMYISSHIGQPCRGETSLPPSGFASLYQIMLVIYIQYFIINHSFCHTSRFRCGCEPFSASQPNSQPPCQRGETWRLARGRYANRANP